MTFALIIDRSRRVSLIHVFVQKDDPEPFRIILKLLHDEDLGMSHRNPALCTARMVVWRRVSSSLTGELGALLPMPPCLGETSHHRLKVRDAPYRLWARCPASSSVDTEDLAACIAQHGPVVVDLEVDSHTRAWRIGTDIMTTLLHCETMQEVSAHLKRETIYDAGPLD